MKSCTQVREQTVWVYIFLDKPHPASPEGLLGLRKFVGQTKPRKLRNFWDMGLRFFGTNPTLPLPKETHHVKTQQFSSSGRLEDVTVPILDPSEVLSYLVDDVGLACPQDEQARYWDFHREYLEGHPASDQHVPVSLYGDDVQINRQGDSITGLYLNLTLFRPKRVRCTHYCIWAMRTHLVAGCFTLWPILAFIVSSLNKAFHGVGKSGTKFALAELKGDWPWVRKILRFAPSFTGNKVCFLCHATVWQHRCPYYDVDGHCAEISTAEYLTTMLDDSCTPSPLYLAIGFSVRMIQICSMHTVNLGLIFTTNGALLGTLIRTGFFGCPTGPGAFETALHAAFDDFLAWRKEKKIRSSQRRFRPTHVPGTFKW